MIALREELLVKRGRNIRAFEVATGVDVDLEEERSSRSLLLMHTKRGRPHHSLKTSQDGRVQPVRIEEIVRQTQKDLDKILSKLVRFSS